MRHEMDSKKVEYHFHGNVIIGSNIQDAYNTTEFKNIGSTGGGKCLQYADVQPRPKLISYVASPTDPKALPRNRQPEDDGQEEEELDDTSSHSSTTQVQPNTLDARPPAIPFNTRPAISGRSGTVVGPEFHSTPSTPTQTQWLDRDLNDEPVPLAPSPPIEGINFTPQGQDGAQNAVNWDTEIEHHEIRPGHCNLAGGSVSLHNRTPEWEQWEQWRVSQSPGFPVPSILSSPPISTYASYGGSVTSLPAYPMPVPSHCAGWPTASCPPFPTAEVHHEGLPAPITAYVFPRMPSPSIPALARLTSTPSTFTSDPRSPRLYGGPDRSATFAGTPSSPALGFPVPQFHPLYRQT
jgi:hypothetical protein